MALCTDSFYSYMWNKHDNWVKYKIPVFVTSRSVGFDLIKKSSFWPVLNVSHKLSISWSIFCLFCYRHKFWYNPELQRTFCFSFCLFLSYHYDCFFLIKQDLIVCVAIMVFYSYFCPWFLNLFKSICIERWMLTWSFKN